MSIGGKLRGGFKKVKKTASRVDDPFRRTGRDVKAGVSKVRKTVREGIPGTGFGDYSRRVREVLREGNRGRRY